MTSATIPSRQSRSALTTFTAVAIYDGLAASFRAREALAALEHILPLDVHLRPLLWSFQKLERLDIRAMALHAAAAAEMIIIAAAEDAALPPHIERWLDACLAGASATPPVLVALADDEACGTRGQGGAFRSSVRHIASRWQADFMGGTDFDQQVDAGFVRQRLLPQAPPLNQQPWQEFGTSPRLYGIND